MSSDDDHSATLREIALTVSVFPIKHIFAGASDRRLVKVHPAGGATLGAGADEDHLIVGLTVLSMIGPIEQSRSISSAVKMHIGCTH